MLDGFLGCEREVREEREWREVREAVLCFWREIGFVIEDNEKNGFIEDWIEGLDWEGAAGDERVAVDGAEVEEIWVDGFFATIIGGSESSLEEMPSLDE